MRKGIIIGIGILVILLALAGTGSAHPVYGGNCMYCHSGIPTPLTATGTYFKSIHKFNGSSEPLTAGSCTQCHVNPPTTDLSMTLKGQNYSTIHNGGNTSGYASTVVNCTYCHTDPYGGDFTFLSTGTTFRQIHKFNGVAIPNNATGCTECHTNVMTFLPLVTNGSYYNSTHRYNDTTLASEMFSPPACGNCHVDVINDNFNLSTGIATYLGSTTCQDCHRMKYETWYNTTHRTKLLDNTTAQAAVFPYPPGYTWANITYTIGGKWKVRFVNETGYVITGPLAQYNVEDKKWVAYNNGTVTQYNCGSCHTTGYNASAPSRFGLPGIVGNWTENGIACEACHGGAGSGHQVVVNRSAALCGSCHSRLPSTDIDTQRRHRAQYADWLHSPHASPVRAAVDDSNETCKRCHSPLDYAENVSVNSTTARGVVCIVCHNTHDTSDPQYANLTRPGAYGYNASDNSSNFSAVMPAKVKFYNASQNKFLAIKDIYDLLTTPTLIYDRDSSYSSPINVTGPVSEVLCSKCHYNHGLQHISNVSLTHARNNEPNQSKWATCTDCHMPKSRKSASEWDIRSHTMTPQDKIDYVTAPTRNFPDLTCSRGSDCHVTSNQSQTQSNLSLVSVQSEWKATAHNDKETSVNHSNPNSSFYRSINGTTGAITVKSRKNSCNKCHSPINWNPATDSNTTNVLLNTTDFKGITCTVCHNIHDMGDWIKNTGKVYGWYNRDAINNSGVYQASYTVMDNTTELCGNCHSNILIGYQGPGWNGSNGNPTKQHGFPAKDVFAGSWKQSGRLNFECKDCHMYTNKTNATGGVLNDAEKITGHSFSVNESGLQNTTACSRCHVNGTNVDTIENVIEEIQADTHTKWNATNITVQNALTAVKLYTGVNTSSRDKIAQAYWNLYLVSSDESWGVHDPVGTSKLLDDAVVLANAANASLGQGLVSTVNLKAGWNLVALNGTPSVTSPVSVMSSVASNITVVWGYNTSSVVKWELYDPLMPSGLNSLRNMVPGQGYWIYAKVDTVWTV